MLVISLSEPFTLSGRIGTYRSVQHRYNKTSSKIVEIEYQNVLKATFKIICYFRPRSTSNAPYFVSYFKALLSRILEYIIYEL